MPQNKRCVIVAAAIGAMIIILLAFHNTLFPTTIRQHTPFRIPPHPTLPRSLPVYTLNPPAAMHTESKTDPPTPPVMEISPALHVHQDAAAGPLYMDNHAPVPTVDANVVLPTIAYALQAALPDAANHQRGTDIAAHTPRDATSKLQNHPATPTGPRPVPRFVVAVLPQTGEPVDAVFTVRCCYRLNSFK